MKKQLLVFSVSCLSVCVNAQTVPSYFPQTGLKAAYLFTGNAKDSSGNGNNGTVTGATLTTDRFGNINTSYYFNGLSDYISIPSSSTLDLNDTNFSISLWIKCSNYSPSTPKYIFWRGDGVSAHDPYSLYIYSGQLKFRRDVGSGTTINEIVFPTTTVDTNWHFIVASYKNSGSVMSLYFDGALVKQQSVPGTIGYSTSSFTNMIGNVIGGSANNFNGKIDEIGVWNRTLTFCEIKKMYYSSTSLITTNPLNDTAISGGVATFNISDVDTAITFQWQVNAGSGFTNVPGTLPYSGVNTKTLTINPTSLSMNGYLFRCIRSGSTCNDTSGIANLVVKTSIVNNIKTTEEINIYPNPAHNNICIELTKNNFKGEIELINAMGQIVETKYINGKKTNIDVSHLIVGVYIIMVEVNGEKSYRRFIKQ